MNKTLILGCDNYTNNDLIGFVEEQDTKFVNLDPELYSEYSDSVCKSCNIFFSLSQERGEICKSYTLIFKVHPEFFIDYLKNSEINLATTVKYLYREYSYLFGVEYAKCGLLNEKQLIEGLIKYKEYESFVENFVYSSLFFDYRDKVSNYLYSSYDKCKGYILENYTCKKNLYKLNTKKIPCHHNTLYFCQILDENDRYYIFDEHCKAPLALPNIHYDGRVCWGDSSNIPKNLSEVSIKYFNSPFNGDLVFSYGDNTCFIEMVEGYGFDEHDFYTYDEDDDSYNYDEPREELTVNELVQIIKNGGDNPYKGVMDLEIVKFELTGVKEILRIKNGKKIPDFNEIIDDYLLDCMSGDDLFMFLVNNLEDDIWEAYLPVEEGIYIQINLKDLENYTLED